MKMRLEVRLDDITRLKVDAIVNAANNTLLGGGGVDGSIHLVAGPELRGECERIAEVAPGIRCPTGEARLTGGYNLPARYVIHTVGPIWNGGGCGEAELLESCYVEALKLAAGHDIECIAFPCISTGVYRFPAELAAPIAVAAVRRMGAELGRPGRVIFCCFSQADAGRYEALLGAGETSGRRGR